MNTNRSLMQRVWDVAEEAALQAGEQRIDPAMIREALGTRRVAEDLADAFTCLLGIEGAGLSHTDILNDIAEGIINSPNSLMSPTDNVMSVLARHLETKH